MRRSRKQAQKAHDGKSKRPDILNDILAAGGSISFHTGEYTRKFIGINKIHEEGFWEGDDGTGNLLKIPYKFTAVLGEPVTVNPDEQLGISKRRNAGPGGV